MRPDAESHGIELSTHPPPSPRGGSGENEGGPARLKPTHLPPAALGGEAWIAIPSKPRAPRQHLEIGVSPQGLPR